MFIYEVHQRLWVVLLIMSFAWTLSSQAFAGLLGGIGLGWSVHSFKPLEEEVTPNYYAAGPYGAFGYSIGKVVDLNLFASYHPGRKGSARVGVEDAQFVDYGIEVALRIAKVFYLGFAGGETSYHLVRGDLDEEIEGKWKGPSGRVSAGALIPATRRSYVQITFDVGQANLKEDADQIAGFAAPERQVNWLGVTLSYVYIGLDSFQFDNIVLKNWLDF